MDRGEFKGPLRQADSERMGRCDHDMLVDQCFDCKHADLAKGPGARRVYVLAGTGPFHGGTMCESFIGSRTLGPTAERLQNISLFDAIGQGRLACASCFPHVYA